nr:helix-turn-helix transcriptional regulator [uncultured Psychroserpens sp.]
MMFSNEELVKNTGYWMDKIQNDLYFELHKYMEIHNLSKTELAKHLGFSKGYISQILNGNFNYSLKKLIELSIAIDKVPKIEFSDISKEVNKLNSLNSAKLITVNFKTDSFFRLNTQFQEYA